MNKENANKATQTAGSVRITRSRARAQGPSFEQDHKRILRANVKRAASDMTKSAMAGNVPVQNKKRAVLKDVTNVLCESSHSNCVNVAKDQVDASYL
ncbi:hypothetical protein MLD38_014637 [Melastoma candidum]|uniref:Uncharacterized protein n=1 Tax=Melastoma candidum TaxID=119954 RepID=A0ACB9RCR9_9MYRT|nr:hypothetical protein MLD38_014637 [Melastoma candidum]